MSERTCSIEDCVRRHEARGFCTLHYRAWKRSVTPIDTPETRARFWASVDRAGPVPPHRPDLGPCWLWTGHRHPKGYGHFQVGAWWLVASRVAYEFAVGPIPAGLTIDHLCRNPPCANPSHLEPVTTGENTRRSNAPAGRNSRKTHCDHGHELTPENIYHRPSRPGRRECLVCKRLRARAA